MTFSPLTFWLVVALVLAGIEMFTGTLFLLAVAIGAVSGALVSAIGLPLEMQIGSVAVVSLAATKLLLMWKNKRHPKTDAYPALDIGQRVRVLGWKNERLARVQHRGTQWDGELAPEAMTGQDEYIIKKVTANRLILNSIKSENE